MATIQKRVTSKGEARYRVQIRIPGTKPIIKTFGDKRTAERWAKSAETELERDGALPNHTAEKYTLKQVCLAYQEAANNQDESSIQRLDWWREQLGYITLNRLTKPLIKKRLRELAEKGPSGKPLAPSTVNRYQAALSAALTWAVEEGWISQNPARFKRFREDINGHFKEWLETAQDRRRLLDACRASQWAGLHVIVFLALVTGARRKELSHLRWADVNLEKGTAIALDTKNGTDNMMALPPAAVTLLRAWKLQCGSTMWVFPHPDGKRPYYQWQRHWYVARTAAGFPTLRFHALRHSAASLAIENGASDAQTAALLNHKTLAMVKRYGHVRDAVTRGISEQIAEGLM